MPTDEYMLFHQADEWRMSVRKYLTGVDGPLLYLEWKLWQRYRQAQQRLRDQAG